MCNINSLYTKKGISNTSGFLMAVSSHSYITNHDGDGIYIKSNDKIVKQKQKINYCDYETEINASNVVITHQRFATSGHETEYIHPFGNDNFILVHNGVINQFLNEKGSDTFGFWKRFNKMFNKRDITLTRKEVIIKIVKELFKDDKGSYSILIYDKKEDYSYYFKNCSTQINFYSNEDYLFITTEDDNEKFLSLLTDKKFDELNIEDNIIYGINSEREVYILSELNELKKETMVEVKHKGHYTSSYGDYDYETYDYRTKQEKEIDHSKVIYEYDSDNLDDLSKNEIFTYDFIGNDKHKDEYMF